jgi:hypothetical protein
LPYNWIYIGLFIALLIVNTLNYVLVFDRSVLSAVKLHNSAVYSLMRSPLSFFESNPAGTPLKYWSNGWAYLALDFVRGFSIKND